MNIILSCKEQWRRQVLSTGATYFYDAGDVAGFPFAQLRSATAEFVAGKRGLECPSPDCDSRLTEMIADHVSKGGSREIAILACIHALTPSGAATLLTSLRDGQPDALGCLNYLKCLILAGRACPSLLSAHEIHAAQCLALLLAPNKTPELLFQSLIVSLGQLGYNFFLPTAYIGTVLDFTGFCPVFELKLAQLLGCQSLKCLYNEIAWLKGVPKLEYPIIPVTLLDQKLPSWRLWETWNPNYLRLLAWEGGKLTQTQKQKLAGIMALEGPDVSLAGCSTLKEAVPGCFQWILVGRQDPALPHRLLDLLDKAQAVEGPHAVDLFIHLCVSNAADEGDMDLAKSIIATGDDECCRSTLLVLQAMAPTSGINNRIVALTNGLAGIPRYEILRDRFADLAAAQVVSAVRDAQLEYCRQLQSAGSAENFGLKLHAFAMVVLGTAWIRPRLPPSFVLALEAMPSERLMKDISDHLQVAPASTDAAKAYLAASLGGQSQGDDVHTAELLEALQSRMRLYGSTSDPECLAIVLSIESMPCVDTELARRCQDRLPLEEQIMIKDLRRGLQMEPNALCNELSRMLARRRELQLTVSDCWVSLLRRVMVQQNSSLVVWTAERLASAEWMRWLRDLDVLFPSSGARRDDAEIGVPPGLRTWWDSLRGRYAGAVHKVETLQRGKGSLKWLYLSEISHTATLLELLSEEARLDYLHTSVLAYFDADRQVISNVCRLLDTVGQVSPLARHCLESLLEKHRSPAGRPGSGSHHWRGPALQVMHLGWDRRLRTASPANRADRAALKQLGALVGTAPGWDEGGFASAARLLADEYRGLMLAASALEAERLALRSHNVKRTASLTTKLAIQHSRGAVDARIPDKLSDSIECVKDGVYELAFPLTQLRGYQRTMWGFPSGSTMILVRISLNERLEFCLHYYPNDEGPAHHVGFPVGGRRSPHNGFCNTRLLPFAYLLGRALAKFLDGRKGPDVDFQALHEMVEEVLACPGTKCMVCLRSLPAKIWRPAPCLRPACGKELQRSPMESRVASFLSDPPLVDFLLACVFTAAQDPSGLDLLPQCPIPKEELPTLINSFPVLVDPVGASGDGGGERGGVDAVDDLLARIGQPAGPASAKRLLLLSWMCVTFGGFMLTAPQGSRVPLMPGAHQFLLASSPADRERAFKARNKQLRHAPGATAAGTGGVVFHGAAASRLWLIMTEGLKNMSDTPFMINGSSGGSGIYLADEAAHAIGYGGSLGPNWTNSVFANRTVLLGCELQGHTPANYHVVPDQDRVLVRYVFLCPVGFTPPQTRLIDTAMKSTFASLRTGLF